MANRKIDSIILSNDKGSSEVYDIDLPETATPSIDSITTENDATIGGTISEGGVSLAEKYQAKLTAGTGIEIENNTVSVDQDIVPVSGVNDGTNWTSLTINGETRSIPQGGGGGDYTAGEGIDITNNEISVDPEVVALKEDITPVSGENDGDNWTSITIGNDTYNIPQGGGTTYTAGNGIDITNDEISVDTSVVALKTDLPAAVSGTNDGTNWTALTIGSDTYNIPQQSGSDITLLDLRGEIKSWVGNRPEFGSYVWTDGDNIYYSNSSDQYIWDSPTSTWNTKTWNGLTSFTGDNVWTDGENIYYSGNAKQYILDKETSTWNTKTWNGLTSFRGDNVWIDGENIYYSSSSTHYVLDKETSTWNTKTWNGLTSFYSNNIWTDGESIYYSANANQYILDRETSTWNTKTWNGLTSFTGDNVWKDNKYIYCSLSNDGYKHYVLNKNTSTWIELYITGNTEFLGNNMWTDGKDYFYSRESNQRKILNYSHSIDTLAKVAETGSYQDLTNKPDFSNYVNLTAAQTISGSKIVTNSNGIQSRSSSTSHNFAVLNGYSATEPYMMVRNNSYIYTRVTPGKIDNTSPSDLNCFIIKACLSEHTFDTYTEYRFPSPTTIGSSSTKTVATTDDIPTISGTNDGTNWTAITIGNDTYNIPQGGGGGTEVSGENDGTNWTSLTIDGATYDIPNGIDIIDGFSSKWSYKSWKGLSPKGERVWTDGENIYYSYDSNQYILDKSTSTWSPKTWSGYAYMRGDYIWTDGENIYYSTGTDQYVLDKSTSTWNSKTWTGLTNFSAKYIWAEGKNIYYSDSTEQYVLDKSTSTWNPKTWTGVTNFYGNDIWTDGENIYYSSYGSQYVLDKSISSWVFKQFSGLTIYQGRYIWTGGENIYYSNNSEQYVLDKSTSTWNPKTWTGLTGFTSSDIWTDGENIYFSSSASQYSLDKVIYKTSDLAKVADTGNYNDLSNKPIIPPIVLGSNDGTNWISLTVGEDTYGIPNGIDISAGGFSSEWTPKTWIGITSFVGENVWTDGENIYYSNLSVTYILDRSTLVWSRKTWTGLNSPEGEKVWTDGENIYYSNGDSSRQYVLDKSTSTWNPKTWTGFTKIYGQYIWTDGENIYYSSNSDQYVLDKSTSTWSPKTWLGFTSLFGNYIWTDGENIYYSRSSTNQYVLDKRISRWNSKTWTGLTNFIGDHIWTDGENIYYSNGDSSYQYVLDKSTSTWNPKTWTGLTNFSGAHIWTDGENIYYSSSAEHYKLNKVTYKVSDLAKVADTGSYNDLKDKPEIPAVVSGTNDGANWTSLTVGSDTYNIPQGSGGTEVSGENNGKDWTSLTIDGETYGVANDLNVKIANNRSSSTKTWTGLTSYSGIDIWSDDTNIYYSNSTTQKILDKATSTWSDQIWSGLTSFSGRNVWTDGENIYYSNGSTQYILNKMTQEWSVKEWNGVSDLTYFIGQYIWTDRSNIYLSNYQSSTNNLQIVLDKATSTWSDVTWNYTSLKGNKIWTDGENVYYSDGFTQKILNKNTSQWDNKNWTNSTYIYGNSIWTDGIFMYCSVQVSTSYYHYVLDKDSSTWTPISFGNNFAGEYIWTDGENIYSSYGNKQYQIFIDIIKTDILSKVAKTGSFTDLLNTDSVVKTSTNQLIGGQKVFAQDLYLSDYLNPEQGSYIGLSRDDTPVIILHDNNVNTASTWDSTSITFSRDASVASSDIAIQVGYGGLSTYKKNIYKFIGATTSQTADITKTVATLDDIPTWLTVMLYDSLAAGNINIIFDIAATNPDYLLNASDISDFIEKFVGNDDEIYFPASGFYNGKTVWAIDTYDDDGAYTINIHTTDGGIEHIYNSSTTMNYSIRRKKITF